MFIDLNLIVIVTFFLFLDSFILLSLYFSDLGVIDLGRRVSKISVPSMSTSFPKFSKLPPIARRGRPISGTDPMEVEGGNEVSGLSNLKAESNSLESSTFQKGDSDCYGSPLVGIEPNPKLGLFPSSMGVDSFPQAYSLSIPSIRGEGSPHEIGNGLTAHF